MAYLFHVMTHTDASGSLDAMDESAPMRADELNYDLPHELIATHPVEPRDSARMLVVHRDAQGAWSMAHRHVRDLPEFLAPDDLVVFNVSRVIPARLQGKRLATGGRIEGLFLDEPAPGTWLVMLRSNGKLHTDDRIELTSKESSTSCVLTLERKIDEAWQARVEPTLPAAQLLDAVGATPLPPYIIKARGEANVADQADRAWYQTVYAALDQAGSVAAPTAGLHFTPELLARTEAAGAQQAEVVLHVGAGTFKPVSAPTLAEHIMHEERFTVPARTIEALRKRRTGAQAGRVFAIGTTTVRTLESLPDVTSLETTSPEQPIAGTTRMLIAPGYRFMHVDALLTNFHLPRSTLLALVAAMVGRERWRAFYAEAIAQRYRFYSYGDAMLILP